MSWRVALTTLLAVIFGVGAALIIGWRYGDLLGRWAYLGMALSVLSAISFTALAIAKAAEVSDTALEEHVSHHS